MSSSEFFEFNALPGETFKSFRSGGLECVACGEMWCKHLQKAMVSNADHEFVWWGDWEHKQLSIPLFPSQHIWTQASLDIVPDAPRKYAKLNLVRLDPVEEEMVSYLHPGEGRQIIRTIFIDYMLGQRLSHPNKGICTSPSHKYRQEKLWQERTDSRNKNRVIEFWSVWMDGMCTACRGGLNTDFDPDLIPTDDREKIW